MPRSRAHRLRFHNHRCWNGEKYHQWYCEGATCQNVRYILCVDHSLAKFAAKRA